MLHRYQYLLIISKDCRPYCRFIYPFIICHLKHLRTYIDMHCLSPALEESCEQTKATSNHIFFRIWNNEDFQASLLSYLDEETLCSLRLSSSDCCHLITPALFKRTYLNFTSSALSKPSRLRALATIGKHIKHLTFSMPHTASTFLPPLLNPITGREITFLYTPYTSLNSESHRPKYGTHDLGNVLTDQYPPIFHAATNVPSFIRCLSHMPSLHHLSISTPNQEPSQRYRRSAVDYALISLRIALESVHLPQLTKMTLSVHPSALLYLKNTPSIGSSPRSTRLCSQIRKLKITLDSWDFHGKHPGHDNLKLLDTYIRSFSSNLERISFKWNGARGPCPLTLPSDPLLAPPRKTVKLFAEITSPMSPLPAAPPISALLLPKLRYLRVRNVLMAPSQVSDLVYAHRKSVREFNFEDVELSEGGDWEEALSPLTKNLDGGGSAGERWRSEQSFHDSGYESKQSLRTVPSNLDKTEGPWRHLGDDEILDTSIAKFKSEVGKPEKLKVITTTRVKKRRVKHRRRRYKDAHDDHEVAAPSKDTLSPRALFGAIDNQREKVACSPVVPSRPLFGALSELSSPAPTLWPKISAPILDTPLSSRLVTSTPDLSVDGLQPTVFDPFINDHGQHPSHAHLHSQSTTVTISPDVATINRDVPAPLIVLQAKTFNSANTAQDQPSFETHNSNTPSPAVKRNHLLDARLIELAEDAEKRQSALRKAREAVLVKLTSQLGKTSTPKSQTANPGGGPRTATGIRGLFGMHRSGHSGQSTSAGHGRLAAASKTCVGHRDEAMTSTRSGGVRMDSATQLVPLMIFR